MASVTFRNSRGLRLVGKLLSVSEDRLILMAHGFTSDKSSGGRFDYLGTCLKQAGFSSLAFDFSGCGESDDDSLTVSKQIDDLRSAIAFGRSRGFRNIALWGNSLGTRSCLEADPTGVWAMVLTGAATGPMHYAWDKYFSREQLAKLHETGLMTVPVEDGPRRRVIVDRQLFQDFVEFDQKQILGRVTCPVLLIHGDSDEEERQLTANSRCGLAYLPKSSRLEVLEGAKHGFYGYLDRIVQLGLDWLMRTVPR